MGTVCAICNSRQADKTNSHLIPSFFLAMVSSIDDSYERDRELLYTIGDRSTTAYIDRRVREEELVDSFDSLSEERLEEMSKPRHVSKDYIFCSHCEKKLGEYLESPWHDHLFKGRKIPPDTAYFFWVSLLWRISVFEGISLKLPTHIEKSLGKRLDSFIQARDKSDDTSLIMRKVPFVYKVLYSKDYSKQHEGFIYSEYDKKSKIATLLLGDVVACFSFHKHGSFDKHSFYGLESLFANAPVNDGICEEAILNMDAKELKRCISNIIPVLQAERLLSDKENIIKMWQLVKQKTGLPLPAKPSDIFIQCVMSELYDDSTKTGERTTHEYFAKCFKKGLEKEYGFH